MKTPDRLQAELGAQLVLLPELEIVPMLPKGNTLAAHLLHTLALGARLTHPNFQEISCSWRLSAIVFDLRALGWQVLSDRIPAPTAGRPDRKISLYMLAPKHCALVRGERPPGADGATGSEVGNG